MQQKLKRNAVVVLVAVLLLGLGYWFVSAGLFATKAVSPQQDVEQQPRHLEAPYQVISPQTGGKTAPVTIPDSQTPEQNHAVRKGLIVVLKPDAVIDANGTLAKYLNMSEVSQHKLQHLNMITLVIPEAWELEPIHKEIAQDPAVLSVSKNAPAYMQQITPNDPLFAHDTQWALGNISAPQAWHYTTGDETVVIAVMDNGLDYTHPDLAGNAWVNETELQGLPFVDDDHPDGPKPCHPRVPELDLFCDDIRGTSTNSNHASNDSQDTGFSVSHGTAVASIIAAFGNNGAFSTGVAWRARILPVTVFNAVGRSAIAQYVQAVNYLIEMKRDRGVNIRAINLSGSGLTGAVGRAVFQALENANILFIQAAGNRASPRTSEATYPLAPILIRVASISRSGAIASGSNFGPLVHLAAPGVAVPALVGRLAYATSNNYPVFLLSNVSNPANKGFDQWLIQPPDSWTIAQTGQILRTRDDTLVTNTAARVFEPAIGAWYQSTPAETILAFPTTLDLSGYAIEDVLFKIRLAGRPAGDTSLFLDLGTDTTSSTTWYPFIRWRGATPSFLEYRLHPSSTFGGGNFQDYLRVRFRTTASMDNRDYLAINSISVSANPPIPPFSDIPQSAVNSYFPPRNGTSYAAPHVTGVAALVWAHRPELSAAQVQSVITNPENLDPFPCVKSNLPCVASQGTLNAFKILTAITTAEVSILGADEIVTQPNQAYAFPVRLHRAPGVFNTATERVVFETEISYHLDDEMVVHRTSLTFTLDNWYQPQPITLTNQADALGDGLFMIPDSDQRIIATIRLQASESPDSDPDFAMTTAEKRICLQKHTGQPLILGLCRLTGLEGEPIAYHLTLSQRPDSTLTLSIAVMPRTAGNVSPAQLTFTPDNWNTPQTLIVHPSQVDLLRNIPQRLTLQATLSDTSSDLISSITQTITLLDNQTSPTLVFAPRTPFLLTGFSTQTLTLRLGGQAASEVQVSLSSEPQDLLELSPNTLRFTPQNWNQAQTISLRTQRVGTFPTTITAQVDANLSDPQYHGVTAVLPGLIRTQDLRILGLSDQTLVEGALHDYALMLSATPNQTIHINPVVEPSDSAVFIPQTLTFTPDNWNTTQTLSVRASVDFHNATNRTARIILNGMPSHLMLPATSHLTITDSDESIPDFIVQPEQLRLQDGRSQTLSIRLNGNPDDRLDVALVSSYPQRVRVSPSVITFTPQNWFEPQRFSVFAAGFITTNTIVTAQADHNSPDTVFRAALKQVPVSVDRRAIRLVGFEDRTVVEGVEHTYHLSLSTTPNSIVSLRGASSFSLVSFNPIQLSFTEDDWNIPKPLTVRVLPAIYESKTRIMLIVLENTLGQLAEIGIRFLTVLDDGRTPGPVGFVLEPPGPLFVTQGHHDTLRIKLAGQPALSVFLGLVVDGINARAYRAEPSEVLFSVDNWDVPRSVELTSALRESLFPLDLLVIPRYVMGITDSRYDILSASKLVYSPFEVLGLANKVSTNGQSIAYTLRLDFPNPVLEITHPDQNYQNSPTTVTTSSEPPNAVDFEPEQLFFPQGRTSLPQGLVVIPRPDLFQKQQRIMLRLASSERFVRTTTAMLTVIQQFPQLLSTPADSLSISRQDQQNQIIFSLDKQPEDPITLDLSTDNPDFMVSPARLSFTTSNWDRRQAATVVASPGTTAIASLSLVADSANPDSPIHRQTKTLGLHPLHLLGLQNVQIGEGDSFTYQLRLTSTPDQTVSLVPELDRSARLTSFPQEIVFAPNNWNTPQEWTVHAPRDLLNNQDRVARLMLVDSSAQLLATPTATIEIRDDGQAAALIIVPDAKLSLDKLTPLILQVHLAGQPQSTVVLTLSIADNSITATPAVLTFTPGNWNQPQPVSLRTASQTSASTNTTLTIAVDNARSDMQFHHVVRELQVTVQVRSRLRVRVFLEGTLQ